MARNHEEDIHFHFIHISESTIHVKGISVPKIYVETLLLLKENGYLPLTCRPVIGRGGFMAIPYTPWLSADNILRPSYFLAAKPTNSYFGRAGYNAVSPLSPKSLEFC